MKLHWKEKICHLDSLPCFFVVSPISGRSTVICLFIVIISHGMNIKIITLCMNRVKVKFGFLYHV